MSVTTGEHERTDTCLGEGTRAADDAREGSAGHVGTQKVGCGAEGDARVGDPGEGGKSLVEASIDLQSGGCASQAQVGGSRSDVGGIGDNQSGARDGQSGGGGSFVELEHAIVDGGDTGVGEGPACGEVLSECVIFDDAARSRNNTLVILSRAAGGGVDTGQD